MINVIWTPYPRTVKICPPHEMSRLLIVLYLVAIVKGDMCEEFCLQELGEAICHRGSWCKNGYDCHSLFWTGVESPRICVFGDVDETCQDENPVLCTEAAVFFRTTDANSFSTDHMGADMGDSFTGDEGDFTGLISELGVSSSPTGLPFPSLSTTTEGAISFVRGERPIVGTAKISLHYSETAPDSRPRIYVGFLGSDQDEEYSLLFDTGSDVSHILAADGEGYVDVGAGRIVGGEGELVYGSEWCERSVPVIRKITEMARITGPDENSDYFVLEIEINLTSRIDDRNIGIGLFGAGRTSHFAHSVGAFAFMGQEQKFRPHFDFITSHPSGTLLIGEDFAFESFCQQPLAWTRTEPQISDIHWVVSGLIGLQGDDDSLVGGGPVHWLIDTGASSFFLPEWLYHNVITRIAVDGSTEVIHTREGTFPLVMDCRNMERWPVIELRFGDLRVLVYPHDYSTEYNPVMFHCYLKLQHNNFLSVPTPVTMLSVEVLSKLITVFDRRNDRVGFCYTRA